eukprot:Hpha_TRINITY_DN7375_c0_g1::TRINITY_DN7375_c0_g1_i1::g.9876::m.9876
MSDVITDTFVSPGRVLRQSAAFTQSWSAGLQRYILSATAHCPVHSSPDSESAVVAWKRQYDGIAADKADGAWLRIAEGPGTEAGLILRSTPVPGGYCTGQRVHVSGQKQGTVTGPGERGRVRVCLDGSEDSFADVSLQELELCLPPRLTRLPTMLWGNDAAAILVPPHPEDLDTYTVVLDLDETLVSTRGPTVYARPGVDDLFAALSGVEVIVWTAGLRPYAQEILKEIAPEGMVKHLVYRHPQWCSQLPAVASRTAKDLSRLGRRPERTVMVDNSRQACAAQPGQCVLVPDYMGGDEAPTVLLEVTRLLKELITSGASVTDFFASSKRVVAGPPWELQMNVPGSVRRGRQLNVSTEDGE